MLRRTKLLSLGGLVLLLVGLPIAVKLLQNRHDQRGKASGSVSVTVDLNTKDGISQFNTGGALMQYTLNVGGNATAIQSGKQLMTNSLAFISQPIMGAGTGNPKETPTGLYTWASLDARVKLIVSTGKIPVLTLWGAPTWMLDPNWSPNKYCTNGSCSNTDWSQIEAAPLQAHEQDFANLSRDIAARYNGTTPDPADSTKMLPKVDYFNVWGELHGFWNPNIALYPNNAPCTSGQTNCYGGWDYVKYNRMYKLVYDGIKAVRSDAKIGGPYSPIHPWQTQRAWAKTVFKPSYGYIDQRAFDMVDRWLDWLLANKRPDGSLRAEFLTVDGGINVKDYNAAAPFPTDIPQATEMFADATSWIKNEIAAKGITNFPIWWPEAYVHLAAADLGSVDPAIQAAALAMQNYHLLKSGVTAAFRWTPEEQPNSAKTAGSGNRQNLFSSTLFAGGGQPFPSYYSYKYFYDYFKPGTQLYKTIVSSDEVAALASATNVLLINKKPYQVTVSIFNLNKILEVYASTIVPVSSVIPSPTLTPTKIPTPSTTSGLTATATQTPTPLPSNIPTSLPTLTFVPTATGLPSTTRFTLALFLHGIGKGGDNVSSGSGNMAPLHPQRTVTVEVYNGTNQLVMSKLATIDFQPAAGNFIATVDMGNLASGVYLVKMQSPGFLRKTVGGIVSVIQGSPMTIASLTLITGDSNHDNSVNILDYQMILDCFSDLSPAKNCSDPNKKFTTDLTDDGNVNQFDYNLFLRELSVQIGQ